MGALAGILLGVLFFLHSARRDRRLKGLVTRSLAWLPVWAFSVLAALVILAMEGTGDAPAFHPAYLLALVVLWPNLLFRLLVRPAGWTWGAYGISLLANRTWGLAPRTGATCAALLARLRKRDRQLPRPGDNRLLLRRAPGPGRGPLVATHLLAEALRGQLRDERQRARVLMETILYLPPRARGEREAALAKEWLLLDAAERGAWHELRSAHLLSRDWLQLGAFLLAAGRRLEGQETARWKLAALWLSCGRPWATRHLLRRAWAIERRTNGGPDEGAGLDRALGVTAAGAAPKVAAEAWLDALEHEQYRQWLEDRCRSLELDVAASAEQIRESVSEALSDMALSDGARSDGARSDGTTSGSSLGAQSAVPPELAAELMGRQQASALARLDESLDLVVERLQAEVTPLDDPYDDVDAWCHLQRYVDESLRLGASKATIYFQVLEPVWQWASRLHGARRQRPLAQAIFAWLHAWAVEVGDEQHERTLWDNARLPV